MNKKGPDYDPSGLPKNENPDPQTPDTGPEPHPEPDPDPYNDYLEQMEGDEKESP